MVVERIVNVNRDDVHVFIARIPASIECGVIVTKLRIGIDVPYPKQILEAICFYHAVKDESIKLFVAIATADTPPEPTTACFMKWAPDNGDVFFLQLLEQCRNFIDVVYDVLVFLRSFVDFLAGGIFESLSVIEARVAFARTFCSIGAAAAAVTVHGVGVFGVEYSVFADFPMPCECRNAAQLPKFFCHQEVVFGIASEPAFIGMSAGGKEHVETANGGVVPCAFVEFGNIRLTFP